MKRFFYVFIALHLYLICANAQETGLEIIHADKLTNLSTGKSRITKLTGNANCRIDDNLIWADEIIYRKEAGKVELRENIKIRKTGLGEFYDSTDVIYSDWGDFFVDRKFMKLYGHVRIHYNNSITTSNNCTYDVNKEVLKLYGNVRGKRGKDSFSADTVRYAVKAQKLTAIGEVYAHYDSLNARLYCGNLSYNVADSVGFATINPRLILESEGETIDVNSKIFEFYIPQQSMVFSSDVNVDFREYTGTSKMMVYNYPDSLLSMVGNPLLFSEQDSAFAQRIDVKLKDKNSYKILLDKEARMITQSRGEEPADSTGNMRNVITGDLIDVDVINKEIEGITAIGNASAKYYKPASNEFNDIKGEKIILYFRENKISSIEINENIEGVYRFDK